MALSGQISTLPKTVLLITLIFSLTVTYSYAQIENQAETEDSDRKILIDSDLLSSKIEGQVRLTTFTTNVTLTQGTMEIFGDAAVTLTSAGGDGLEKVTIYGHPARFKILSAETDQLTEGESETIVFEPNNQGEMRIITLAGGVRITQQPSEIFGDNAVIVENMASHDIEKVTVIGQPARYIEQAENAGQPTEGSGNSIVYTLTDEIVVEFVDNAQLTQPKSSLSCATITYYPDGKRTSATGGCRGLLDQSNQ